MGSGSDLDKIIWPDPTSSSDAKGYIFMDQNLRLSYFISFVVKLSFCCSFTVLDRQREIAVVSPK